MKNKFFYLSFIFIMLLISQPVVNAQFEDVTSHSPNSEKVSFEETERRDEIIPYDVERRPNAKLPKGEEKILQKGINGTRTIVTTYIVETDSFGNKTRKVKDSNTSETNPQTEIVEYGTAESVAETTQESTEATNETSEETTKTEKIGGSEEMTKENNKSKKRRSISNKTSKFNKNKSKKNKNTEQELLPQTSEINFGLPYLGISLMGLAIMILKESK